MKIVKLTALLLSLCIFSACVDTVETIEINSDNSGNYSLTMDMGKMLEMAGSMGAGKNSKKEKEKKDTIIYFKEALASSADFTAEQKELFKDGFCKIKLDEANNEMKIIMSCPFKKIDQLATVKKDLSGMLDKLGIMEKAAGKAGGQLAKAGSKMGGDKDLAGSINPSEKYYNFAAVAGKLSYSIPDKAGFKNLMAADSAMQMMQQMSAMMGEMTNSTVIKLPKPAKKVSNPKAVLSEDKKIITIKGKLGELMEKPEESEYEIEY